MSVVVSPWEKGKSSKGWRVRVKVRLPDGRMLEVSKKSPLDSKTASRAWGLEIEKRLWAEALAPPKPVEKPPAPTIAEFVLRFLDYLRARRRAPATLVAYGVALRCHIVPTLGKVRLDEVSSDDHEKLLKAIAELKPSTASEIVKTFNRVLTVAEELKVVHVKLSRCPPIKREAAPVRAYSSDEAARLIAACTQTRDKALVMLGLHGGLRRSEIAALRVEDFSPRCNSMTICRHVWRRQVLAGAKHGAVRTIHLSATAAAVLRGYIGELASEWLFPSNAPARRRGAPAPWWVGGPTTGGQIADRLKTVCQRAGVSYAGAHMMRRSAATAAARSGASPAALAAFLGHKDLRQAQVYIAQLGDDGARIAASLDGYGAEPRARDTGSCELNKNQ